MILTASDKTIPATTNVPTINWGKSSLTEGMALKMKHRIKTMFKISPTLVRKRKAFITVKNADDSPKYHYFAQLKIEKSSL
jgi:hypothetical protein